VISASFVNSKSIPMNLAKTRSLRTNTFFSLLILLIFPFVCLYQSHSCDHNPHFTSYWFFVVSSPQYCFKTMGFNLNTAPRDWSIALTDLLLAVAAFWAANHATATPSLNLDQEVNLVFFAFASLAFCAFLGFIRWGFVQFNKYLNQLYSFFILLTKFASIPFLLANLINQPYVSKTALFSSLHLAFFLTELIRLDSAQKDQISQLLSVIPIICIAIQAFLQVSILHLAVVVGFLCLPLSSKQSTAAFHVVLAILCWVIESARTGQFIQKI